MIHPIFLQLSNTKKKQFKPVVYENKQTIQLYTSDIEYLHYLNMPTTVTNKQTTKPQVPKTENVQ